MTNLDIMDVDVLQLLPQRPPFIMIDHLTHFDRIFTSTCFTVRPDNVFVEDGILNPCALVENIAQTCAARMGYVNLVNSDNVKLGFIGSVRHLVVGRDVKVGETLHTTIEVVSEVLQLTLVNATIKIDGEVVVEAEMKIAQSDIEAKFNHS
jgi:predicted hotdog family 3-hydroxylacyl-ACP dehydratase